MGTLRWHQPSLGVEHVKNALKNRGREGEQGKVGSEGAHGKSKALGGEFEKETERQAGQILDSLGRY